MSDEVEKPVVMDVWLVALVDDRVRHWADEEDAPFLTRLTSVYLYDRNQVTHCCELTPSYCLYWLYDYVDFKDAVELSAARREKLQERYESPPDSSVTYVHCHDVERLDNDRSRSYVHGEEVLPEDVTYDDALEGLLEYYRGNWVL